MALSYLGRFFFHKVGSMDQTWGAYKMQIPGDLLRCHFGLGTQSNAGNSVGNKITKATFS